MHLRISNGSLSGFNLPATFFHILLSLTVLVLQQC